jgi:hypothetical protein
LREAVILSDSAFIFSRALVYASFSSSASLAAVTTSAALSFMSSAKSLALDEVTLALAAASIASCDDFSAVLAESLAFPKTSSPLFLTSSTLLFLDSSSASALFSLSSYLCFYSN